MPGTAGPRLGLVWGYAPHETGWGIGGFNPNFALLEALVHLTIISITATPPGSPANGDCYVVGSSATGAWAGHDKAVAIYYTSGGWVFVAPVVGLRAFNRATDSYWRYSGTAWITETAGSVTGPGSAVDGNVPVFDGTSGEDLRDSGKPLPVGAIVGDTDTQILTNKIIDGAHNSLVVRLDTDVVGNLDPSHLDGGFGATATTAWFGDGTWKYVATTGAGPCVVSDAPPALPAVGTLWFDSADTMALYVFYDDGVSQYWVATSPCSCG
jgi:hypothetical protein